MLRKVPTASTAVTIAREKNPLNGQFSRDNQRSVLEMAVGQPALAGDDEKQCRPQQSPANLSFTGGAGDAGGILRGLVVIIDKSPLVFLILKTNEPPKPP